ncbi:MAG: HAD-IA family hydrolase [bacterium]|nr:HAD-IA family hydrolase [bacterium]
MTHTFDVAAVLFDNDGTLVDSYEGIVASWTEWAIEHEVSAEQLSGHDGRSTKEIVRDIIAEERYESSLARIDALEELHAEKTVAAPGAHEALESLPREAWAVATSGIRPVASARLAAAGLPVPEALISSSDVERAKPAPDIFLRAAELLGVAPTDCLVVEDAPHGVTAAKAAGCAVLAVTTTVGADALEGADAVVGGLDEASFAYVDGRVKVTVPGGVSRRAAAASPRKSL